MAINAAAVWRIRPGGNDENGAGFDSTISGAGTDYSQQDAPQLSLADIATSGAGVTTITSATGGFTAAMIGNAIRIRSGTNFTTGYYYITAFTNSSTVTLDRSPTPSAAGSSGAGKVGGAAATYKKLLDNGNAADEKVVAGNTVYIRGSGSDSPSTEDYPDETGHITPVLGSVSAGRVKLIGENGRPRFRCGGLMFHAAQFFHAENLYLSATNFTNGSLGVVNLNFYNIAKNIVVDTNNQPGLVGILVTQSSIVIDCEVKSGVTSPTLASGSYGILVTSYASAVINNYVHHMRDQGIRVTGGYGFPIYGNIVAGCVGDGICINNGGIGHFVIGGNTIDGGLDDGITIDTNTHLNHVSIFNNNITNHTQTGKYGINIVGGSAAENDRFVPFNDFNNLYNNATARNNLSAGPNDTALDPQYVDAANGNFEIGTNLKAKGFPKSTSTVGAGKSSTNSFVDIGAAQREEPAGGGGGSRGVIIGG